MTLSSATVTLLFVLRVLLRAADLLAGVAAVVALVVLVVLVVLVEVLGMGSLVTERKKEN